MPAHYDVLAGPHKIDIALDHGSNNIEITSHFHRGRSNTWNDLEIFLFLPAEIAAVQTDIYTHIWQSIELSPPQQHQVRLNEGRGGGQLGDCCLIIGEY